MDYKLFLKSGAVIAIAAILSLAACKRDKDTTPVLTSNDDNGGYASDAAKMEQSSNDVISIADIAAASGGSNLRTTGTTLGGCATVTNNISVNPHVLTIDFGSTNCQCLDLRYRKGKIIVTYTGLYKDSGSTHTISYDNYFINNVQLTGHKAVTNMGTNTAGQVWYDVTVNDSLIFAADSVISWVGNRTRTWLAGYNTNDRSDDEYAIGGTTTLTRANGHSFVAVISPANPLKIALACNWIEAGIVTVSGTSFAGGDRILDYSYGTGACDNKVLLTVGTHTYVISMW